MNMNDVITAIFVLAVSLWITFLIGSYYNLKKDAEYYKNAYWQQFTKNNHLKHKLKKYENENNAIHKYTKI